MTVYAVIVVLAVVLGVWAYFADWSTGDPGWD
jgi:hypothetical protein